MTRQQAWELLRRYNAEPFHLRHALTVEGVMRCFAEQRGYDPEFWGIVGLLHDIDFEQWPEQHCVKAPELLQPRLGNLRGYQAGARDGKAAVCSR